MLIFVDVDMQKPDDGAISFKVKDKAPSFVGGRISWLRSTP